MPKYLIRTNKNNFFSPARNDVFLANLKKVIYVRATPIQPKNYSLIPQKRKVWSMDIEMSSLPSAEKERYEI